jgi:hypothetical protein
MAVFAGDRELGETFVNTAAELGKKVDSLGEVLLIKNLPENERKMVRASHVLLHVRFRVYFVVV